MYIIIMYLLSNYGYPYNVQTYIVYIIQIEIVDECIQFGTIYDNNNRTGIRIILDTFDNCGKRSGKPTRKSNLQREKRNQVTAVLPHSILPADGRTIYLSFNAFFSNFLFLFLSFSFPISNLMTVKRVKIFPHDLVGIVFFFVADPSLPETNPKKKMCHFQSMNIFSHFIVPRE